MFSNTAAGRFLSAIHKMTFNPRKSSRPSSLRSMSSGSTASSASLRTPTDYGARPVSPKSAQGLKLRNVRFDENPVLRIDTVNIPHAIRQLDALLTPPEERTFWQAEVMPKSRPLPPIPGEAKFPLSVRINLPASVNFRALPENVQKLILRDSWAVSEHYEDMTQEG